MERKYNIGVTIDLVCLKYDILNYDIRYDGKVDVRGNFYCYNNNLLDVEALTKCRIGGNLDINNPISSIISDIDDLEHFYLINPLNGNKLSKELYDEVREDLGLPKFNYRNLHIDIVLID